MKVLERFRQELQRSIAGMPIQCQSDLSIYLSIYILYIYIFIYLFIYIKMIRIQKQGTLSCIT